MESYEEFALRTLTVLQEEGKSKEMEWKTHCSLKELSTILFYQRAVLPPLLSTEQCREMRDYRQRAVQLDVDRQTLQKDTILARIQNILDQAQETANGYTLVTDSPALLRGPGCALEQSDLPTAPPAEPQRVAAIEGDGVKPGNEEGSDDDEGEEEDISLDSFLKRSREYVEKEQSRRGLVVISRVSRTPPPESVSDKENGTRSPVGDSGVDFGFSGLHHSPVGPPQAQASARALGDPHPHCSGCLPPSLHNPPHPRLPSPEPILAHPTQRRRPRPVSAGNIHISFPVGPTDLIPGASAEARGGATAWVEALSAGIRGSDHRGQAGSGSGVCSGTCSSRSSRYDDSPVGESCSPVRTSVLSPLGHHEHLASDFRRRCHTLDSQLYPCRTSPGAEPIDRSQERLPRFMAGVTRLRPSRSNTATPLNQSYNLENSSPGLLRPHIAPGLAQVTVRCLELVGPQGPDARTTKTVLRNSCELRDCNTEETQCRVQASEDIQKLKEEYSLQMSLLLAEQEKEQQSLHLEMVGPPSPLPSNLSSPSIHPVYIWGPSKTRARLSQVLTAEQQKSLCRLGAIARGFLTRRLLETEKVKHLRKTVVDTQEFIRSFQSEGPLKRGAVSPQDISLQDRVRAQLRAALYDVNDIFFEMPLGERFALLQQERERRAERKLRETEKSKNPKDRVPLSAATQKALDRKKRVAESPAEARKILPKPRSSATGRIIKPNHSQNSPVHGKLNHQGIIKPNHSQNSPVHGKLNHQGIIKPNHSQNSPVHGKLNRQGSWRRKTPEDRLRRSESLKKQHSLG